MTITVNLNNDPVKIKTLQIVKRLKKYFPELPRTKMAAYNHLKKLGYYGDINA